MTAAVTAAALAPALLLAGCSATRVTDPERTATEQFLLSRAASAAVDQLSFDVLRGRKVFLDTEYFAASESAFVIGEVRAKLLRSGVELTRKYDDAQVVLELRSSGVGIDRDDFLLGIPSIQLAAGASLTPELAVVRNRIQNGVAGVSYVAYWRASGEIVASSGPYIGRSVRDDWWFFGVGPRSTGNIAPIRSGE